MKTILKGALVALTLAATPLIGAGAAEASDVGVYAGSNGVSGYYDSYHHWHAYRRYGRRYERPYVRAAVRHDWCWYHRYNWRCRNYRYGW